MLKFLLNSFEFRKLALHGARNGAALTQDTYELHHYTSTFEVDGLRQTHFVPAAASDRPASASILKGKYYEQTTHMLLRLLFERRPGDLIHAGTFFGDMLPSFAAACPGTVYAFEPVLESYVLARQCVNANDLQSVHLFNSGLSRKLGGARIMTHRKDVGENIGGGARIRKNGGTQITTVAIDSLGLKDLSVLQLDLEGHERLAVMGARKTIERCRPVVLLEDAKMKAADVMDGLGYVHVGELPSQNIWATPDDVDDVAAMIIELAKDVETTDIRRAGLSSR